jgi:hypothetical protein
VKPQAVKREAEEDWGRKKCDDALARPDSDWGCPAMPRGQRAGEKAAGVVSVAENDLPCFAPRA